jgi:PAS domain S-box-containing protein
MLLIAYLGFDTLSSARAYVGGEGLWSKAQKDAVYHLTRFAINRDPGEYQAFQTRLAVPLGDRVARLELERPTPQWDSVRAGFERGRNHPDDIPGMGRFFRRFRRVGFVAEAIDDWTRGDSLIASLEELGDRLHGEVLRGTPDQVRIHALLAEVNALSRELSQLEDAFSGAMGAGARWATTVLLLSITAVAGLLLLLGFISLHRAAHRFEAAEASRRSSEAELREMVQHAQFGILRANLEGALVRANPALVRMLGHESEADLLAIEVDRGFYLSAVDRAAIVDRLRKEGVATSEPQLRRKDGGLIHVRFHGRLIPGTAGALPMIEAFVEDVTQQRQLEARLRQAQKMEVVGQLTGGLAHDFNNLLTVILSTAKLLEHDLPPGAKAAQTDLADLTTAARRGADTIRKLLAFSRDRQLQFQPLAIGPLVEASATALKRLLPPDIEVRVEVDPDTPLVYTDPASIEQILLNLATNARDAMPRGGLLRIHVRAADSSPGEGRSHALLSVSDNGMGMDPRTRERLFEPFFTTKTAGRGMGLGLTMVHGLVTQHGGRIEVRSAPGEGTEVRIYFPAAESAMAVANIPVPVQRPGGGTILLVEDEASLRRATQRLLERHGFEVLSASDGLEALGICERQKGRVDLILSDIVMPRMSGTVLYDELQRRGVEIPFVLTSGYTARDGAHPAALPEGVPFIAKPWEIQDLLLKIHQALETSASEEGPGA